MDALLKFIIILLQFEHRVELQLVVFDLILLESHQNLLCLTHLDLKLGISHFHDLQGLDPML